MNPNRLLADDDDESICELVRHVGEDVGFEVQTATCADQFRALYLAHRSTVVMLDLQMPDSDGVELIRYLSEDRCRAHVLVASGADPKVLATVRRLGEAGGLKMFGVMRKPVPVRELTKLLASAVDASRDITSAALSEAIAGNGIVVHYQPKLGLAEDGGSRIEAAEALCRWQHPSMGMIMPGDFVPLAEKSGLIAAMTDSVFTTAAGQVRKWRDAGFDLNVAVNLSALLLEDLGVPDRLAGFAQAAGVPNSSITVEITESGVMADTKRAMDILSRLRLKNFQLSIDDFGTGYSSLVQLYRMPFTEMKIDKSFVIDMTQNKEAEVIVASIAGLARSLGLGACAEGVEDEAALRFLRDLKCQTAQGYLIGKPMPADQLVELIGGWNGRGRETQRVQALLQAAAQ